MATLKLVTLNRVGTNGKYRIKCALYHKHQTVYFNSPYEVDEPLVNERTRSTQTNLGIRRFMNSIQEKLDNIDNHHAYTAQQLKRIISGGSDIIVTTYKQANDAYTDRLRQEDRGSYAELLDYASKVFIEYTGGDIPLSGITPPLVEGFGAWLRKRRKQNGQKISPSSVNMILGRVRVIINSAIRQMLVKYEYNPFITTRITKSSIMECALSVESLRKIIDYTPPYKGGKVARDMFLLSFYMGGMNLKDMLENSFLAEINYVRSKIVNRTNGNARVILTIPDEAKEILDKYIDKKGYIQLGYSTDPKSISRYMTRALQRIATQLGIKERIMFNSARKTFSTLADDIGLPHDAIDYCMGHAPVGIIAYYTKTSRAKGDFCIQKVIEYVNNPESFSEIVAWKRKMDMMK